MNIRIFELLNGFALQNIWLDKIIIFLSIYFGIIFFVTGFIYLLVSHKEKSVKHRIGEAALSFIAVGGAWIITKIIKLIIASPRPFEILDSVNLLFAHGGGDSFPSGHAAVFGALAVLIYQNDKRAGWIAGIAAVLIGLSRVISGIHFPVDIIVGYVLGGFVGYFIFRIFHAWFVRPYGFAKDTEKE